MAPLKKYRSYTKIVRDISHARKTIKNIPTLSNHQVAIAHALSDDVIEAKKLHARVYLDKGFVDDYEIEDGVLSHESDPHQIHATYFYVVEENQEGIKHVVATARQINHNPDMGFIWFPVIQKADLNLNTLNHLITHNPSKCVEISALAKKRGTSSATILLLYRAMWHHSLKNDHQLWLMACDVRLFQRLKILFGPAIKKAGRVTPYKGGDVVPAILDPKDAFKELINLSRRKSWSFGVSRADLVNFFIEGIPLDMISKEDHIKLEKIFRKKERK